MQTVAFCDEKEFDLTLASKIYKTHGGKNEVMDKMLKMFELIHMQEKQ